MNCGHEEKLILYFYGEAGEGLKAEMEAHLAACGACRGSLAALGAAGSRLAAAPSGPSRAAELAVMTAARAQASRRRGFAFSWRPALLSMALSALMVAVFSFTGRPASADLAWNSGIDSRIDSVEYSVLQAQADLSAATGDWEYGVSAVEDEVFG
ncbi:MAG: anti-sigma factor family protein [Elusimicrobiales bacterium]